MCDWFVNVKIRFPHSLLFHTRLSVCPSVISQSSFDLTLTTDASGAFSTTLFFNVPGSYQIVGFFSPRLLRTES